MFCTFQPNANKPGQFFCAKCGLPTPKNHRYKSDNIPKRFCLHRKPTKPILERLAVGCGMSVKEVGISTCWGLSLWDWEQAKFPIREVGEYKFIVDKVCPNCEHYKDGKCSCCGARGQLVKAKVYMDTESCPAYKW